MSRIPQDELTTLKAATAVKTVAEGAVAELEEMQVAHAINEAANTGEYRVVYSKPISPALRTKLTGKGYTLTFPLPIANPADETIISWEDAE